MIGSDAILMNKTDRNELYRHVCLKVFDAMYSTDTHPLIFQPKVRNVMVMALTFFNAVLHETFH
jgi:hypothetical protein